MTENPMAALEDRLRDFDSTSANVMKLEQLWEKLRTLADRAAGNIYDNEHREEYESLAIDFEHIRKALPTINGEAIKNVLMAYSDIFQNNMDARMIDEPEAMISASEEPFLQGRALKEYRWALDCARIAFARGYSKEILSKVESILSELSRKHRRKNVMTSLRNEHWVELEDLFSTLDRLLGDAVKRPGRWHHLVRHLRFATKQDLDDIVEHDFPSVIAELPHLLCWEGDPLPTSVKDLGTHQENTPLRPIATRLKWSALSPEDFERLCQDIFANTAGWQNPKWLTRTNAPDSGRDIEVEQVEENPLTGTTTRRVIVQCKHRPNASVGIREIPTVVAQMELHGKIDLLIIATSGKYSQEVVHFAEAHNRKDRLPVLQLLCDWDLEQVLAGRPALIAQYQLA